LYRIQGRFAEAEPLLRLAIDLADKDGREHPELTTDLDLLARICLAQMKLADAEKTFKRELALLAGRHGAGALEIVPVLNSLGRVIQIDSKRGREAQDFVLRVIGIRESKQGPEHADLAVDLIRLGRLLANAKVFGDAELAYRRALAIQEKALGAEHVTLAIVLDALGSLSSDQEQWIDAEPFFRRSLGLRESAYSPLNYEVAPSLDNLAGVLYQQKRYAEAEPLYERALFIRTAALGDQHPLVAEAHDALAITQAYQQKYEAAERHYRLGLEIREAHILVSLNNTALARSALEKQKEAEPLYKVALAILERPREKPPDSQTYALTLSNYAGLLEEMGRKPEAAKIEARAKLLRKDEAAKKSE
jgi:tetratricopeptide (TPR) repeat protein